MKKKQSDQFILTNCNFYWKSSPERNEKIIKWVNSLSLKKRMMIFELMENQNLQGREDAYEYEYDLYQ